MLHLSLQEPKCTGAPSPTRTAETVVLATGEKRISCVALPHGNDTVVMPLSEDDAEALTKVTGTARLEWPGGSNSFFRVARVKSLKCIVGFAGPKQANRRRSRRVRLDFSAAISTDGTEWRVAAGQDISRGGMLIAVDSQVGLRPGLQVDFRLQLPASDTLSGRAVVVRVGKTGKEPGAANAVGLRFSHLGLSDSHRLAQFIQDVLASGSPTEDMPSAG